MEIIAVKAAGDWELDVLGIPFGGPAAKDSQGEYFSPRTNLHLDSFGKPLIVYYHGLNSDNTPSGEPEIIGRVKGHEQRSDGVWWRIALDKASEYAKRVWEAAKRGAVAVSSGSMPHLVRTAKDGEITSWPVGELSLWDLGEGRSRAASPYAVALPAMKAAYKRAGIDLPDIELSDEEASGADGTQARPEGEQPASAVTTATGGADSPATGVTKMEEKELQELVASQVAAGVEAAMKKQAEAAEAEAKRQAEIQAKVDAAVKAAEDRWKEEAVKAGRLPTKDAPYVAKYPEVWKFDNLDAADMSTLVGVLNSVKGGEKPSMAAYRALAIKLEDDKTTVGEMGRQAMKYHNVPAAAIKSDEIDYSTLTSYGDEWVGIAYSQALWESIRTGTFVVQNLRSQEVPQGMESMYLPLESTDPTWYKVAENTTYDSTMLTPVATVTSSKLGTGRVQLTLNKMGCRVLWSGELGERSLIPFVSQLRQQIATSGAEQLEYAIIDGDTATTTLTNINDIAGTPSGTELFLLFNGFRKSPLVTTSANSRDGGAISAEDYLETVKLMGTAGINADVAKTAFIVDPNVYWKTLELPEVKTRDVFAAPTIENGRLSGIYGYPLYRSAFMHYGSTARKANSDGKIDIDVTTNNTTGAILAVRWDQWVFGYQRRMTMETTRFANSDTNEIVAMATVGLIQRDTEAAAISYNLTV